MESRTKTILQTVGLFAFILSLPAPALAATVVFDFRAQNIVNVVTLSDTRCGMSDTFTVVATYHEYHVTVWDNGHLVFTFERSAMWYDSAGNLVFITTRAYHEVTGETGLPYSFGLNLVARCTGATPTPGLWFLDPAGFTIREDGTLIETH